MKTEKMSIRYAESIILRASLIVSSCVEAMIATIQSLLMEHRFIFTFLDDRDSELQLTDDGGRDSQTFKTKEATFQLVRDALALTPFYQAFLITAEVPAIYMKEFWAIVSVYKSSIRFTINKKKFSLDVEIFRENLQICPKILGQEFEDLLLEPDILSFIRDLGHTGDITYLTDVNFDYLHQPWRAFATVINKCLSGKETGMNKIHLSRAQIF
ncbi:hypothetical protein Tco_0401254 [Tanacetum coccineum]